MPKFSTQKISQRFSFCWATIARKSQRYPLPFIHKSVKFCLPQQISKSYVSPIPRQRSLIWHCTLSNVSPQPAFCPNYDCSDWKIIELFSGLGRNGQEATLKQPRKLIFQSWNQIFGQVTRQWAWPTGTTQKESTSSAIYCKITISFGEILIFTSTFLGGFFLQIFKPGFLTFSQWDYHPALPG